jgi:hypothetical protein
MKTRSTRFQKPGLGPPTLRFPISARVGIDHPMSKLADAAATKIE